MTLTDWKSLEITQIIFKELENRQKELKETLVTTAGENPLMDRWRCGAIAAYGDVLDIEMHEETQD